MKTFTDSRKIMLLIITIFVSGSINAQTYSGSIGLFSQADVDAFNYSEITGGLTIAGPDIVDLTPLVSLTSVGYLWIKDNTTLTNLTGLENVVSVGGSIIIRNNSVLESLSGLISIPSSSDLIIMDNPALTSLEGLGNITSVHELEIENNESLVSLAGLENIVTVYVHLWVQQNPVLTSLSGLQNIASVGESIRIYRNPALTSLFSSSSIVSVGGGITISQNDALINLSGLENITSELQGISIDENGSLTSISGLKGVPSVKYGIRIIDNPALSSLIGLGNISTTGHYLRIENNDALTDLDGLENILSVGDNLRVRDNNGLVSLEGLNNLKSIERGLIIGSNPALTSLTPLSSLESVGASIGIWDNDALTSLAGLEKITQVGEALSIGENDALTCLAALENITSVPTFLYITNNNVLTNLAGLGNISYAGWGVIISGNPALSSFCDLFELINEGTFGTYDVRDNAVNPTQQEIIDNGPCDMNYPPLAICQDVSVSANEYCQAIVTAEEINNGSTDPDGDELILSISPEGPYDFGVTNVVLNVDDGMGGTAACEAIITVLNDIPVIDAVTFHSMDPVQIGSTSTITVEFTDDNASSVDIQWGDLQEENYTALNGVLSANHKYLEPGVYPVSVTVTDPCGETDVYDYHDIVIYDPDAGFVTGGGWIQSPQGAYQNDLSMDGKANFGFISEYKKDSNTPSGNVNFHFKQGNIKFKAKEYEWLVIAGSNALCHGTGTINGRGEYGFLISAIDGDLIDKHTPDKLRMQIWDTNNPTDIIYDNESGAPKYDDPSTNLGGGSVVIHKREQSVPKGKAKGAIVNDLELDDARGTMAHIYPNPFYQFINVDLISVYQNEIVIDIVDMNGRLVESMFIGLTEKNIDHHFQLNPKNDLLQGVYILRIYTKEGELINREMIIKQR